MSKRKPAFVVPLKGAKLLKSPNSQEKNIKGDNSLTETTKEERNQSKPNTIYPKKRAKNVVNMKNKPCTENLEHSNTLSLQECKTPLPNSLPVKIENQNYSQDPCTGTELYRHEPMNIHLMEKLNTSDSINPNLYQPMHFDDNQTEMSIFDINENICAPGDINTGLHNYSDINDEHILDNLNKKQDKIKFDDLNPSEGSIEISHSLYTASQVISEDPYEIMINAFVNNSNSYDNDNTEENKENELVNGNNGDSTTIFEESPVFLDISRNTEKYRTSGHWDFEGSQESDKSEYLEEDKENLTLLKETLKGGILISDWINQSKKLPSSGRLIQARREAEDSIIKLAKARKEQIEQELKLPDKIEAIALEEEAENSVTDSDVEMEKDRKCEEIAKYSNMVWRRPIKDTDPEMQKGPVLNPPPPAQCTFVTYTPAGQKYTVNMMDGRPKTFKNVGAMMMWDISSQINIQRMIDQIENGSFFPNTLDYEKENKFRHLLKSQKKRLFNWVSAVTWDNLERDINFLISEKDILLCDLAIKKWRPKNNSACILQFLEAIDNVPIDGIILLKNPLILLTLFKLTLVEWSDISQKASNILDKFKTTQGFCDSFKESFRNQIYRYKKASEHLRHLYQQLLITSKFHHVPNIEENLSPTKEKTAQEALPLNSFCWD